MGAHVKQVDSTGKFPGNFPGFSHPGRGENSGKNQPPPLGGAFSRDFPAPQFPSEKFISGEERIGSAGRAQDYWTPSREEMLRKLHFDGMSYGQIAKAFAKDGAPTRNAIGGKLHRLGLTNQPERARSLGATHNQRRHQAKATVKVFPVLAVIPTGETYRVEAFAPLAGTAPRPWTERAEGECKWPIDTGLSCCAAIDRGGYCTAHARMAFQPTKPMTPKDLTTRNWRRA